MKITDYVECFDELTRLANHREYRTDIIQVKKAYHAPEFKLVTSPPNKPINKNDKPANFAETKQYKNTITSLESEIAHYKAKVDSMQTQIVHFQHVTCGLQLEISRLVNNLTSVILKQNESKVI